MNKYLILCITTAVVANALFGLTAASAGAFDPALTYQMDDRRPLPSYIFEGEALPEEEDDGVPTPNIVDDIWGMRDKKQQGKKKPKKPRKKAAKV
jgi:hypothetical protein